MKSASRFLVVLALVTSSAAALAHGRVYFGLNVGPYWGPWYFPPAYYYPPVVERQEPIIIQQQAPVAPPPAYWYFCRPVNAYYPYVKECPSGWERVPAQPPGQP